MNPPTGGTRCEPTLSYACNLERQYQFRVGQYSDCALSGDAQGRAKFRLLREKDLSPVNYKRVAEKDGKEVPWDQIVKGYEYEKGKFVVLKEEDFDRVDLEATQTVDIQDFVELHQIDPKFFYKPYYLSRRRAAIRPMSCCETRWRIAERSASRKS